MESAEKNKWKPRLSILLCTVLLGVFFSVAGYALGFQILPEFVRQKIWESVILKKDTQQWKAFEEIPFPLNFTVYMFNVTNAEEILQGGKPLVKEVGPYVYKLHRSKTDIQWTTDEIISYRVQDRYEFDEAVSGNVSDEDVVTILNPVWNSIIQTAEAESPGALPTLYEALPYVFDSQNSLFISISVKKFLFDGFDLCEKRNLKKGGFATKITCSQMRAKAEESKTMLLLDDRIVFSYFAKKSSFVSGVYSINSGNSKKEEVGKLLLFENDSYLHTWGETKNYCNDLESVTIFSPFVDKNEQQKVFIEDICRTVVMDYVEENIIHEIKGFKFEMRNDTFESAEYKIEHRCFCDNNTRDLDGNNCLGDGLLDLKNCVGAPMVFSFPHLLWADQKYMDTVEGLQPIVDLHSSFVVLEPYTGTPLKISKTAQFNMFIRPIEGIDSIQNVSNAIVPILWLEEGMQLPEKYANLLKSTLFEGLQTIDAMKWGMIVMGLVLMLVGMGCVVCFY